MMFSLSDKPQLIKLKRHVSHKSGSLFAIEDFELGLSIKRVFYITDFTDEVALNNRGDHSHASSSQFIVNIKGVVEICVVNILDLSEYKFTLDSPEQFMFLPANHHIFMNHYSEDAVMLVLCDKNYEDDRVNDFVLPELLDGFREAAVFLDTPLGEIIEKYNQLHKNVPGRMKFKHLSEVEFNQRFANKTPLPHELIEFYRDTDNYILELTEYHSTHARRYMTTRIMKWLMRHDAKKLLDYGCGVGEDSIALLESGMNVTLCDIPGKTYDYAKWRIANRGFLPEFSEIGIDNAHNSLDRNEFDAILCFEVLMHVHDPLQTLQKLCFSLKEGGHLLVTHRFAGNYSLALKQNVHFDLTFNDEIQDQGLSLIETISVWEGKLLYVFQK